MQRWNRLTSHMLCRRLTRNTVGGDKRKERNRRRQRIKAKSATSLRLAQTAPTPKGLRLYPRGFTTATQRELGREPLPTRWTLKSGKPLARNHAKQRDQRRLQHTAGNNGVNYSEIRVVQQKERVANSKLCLSRPCDSHAKTAFGSYHRTHGLS